MPTVRHDWQVTESEGQSVYYTKFGDKHWALSNSLKTYNRDSVLFCFVLIKDC